MKKIPFTLLFILLCGVRMPAQNPTVTEKFSQLYISENFDSSNSYWTTLSNVDNLLIVQEGEYIMQRKTALSPYAVMANFNCELTAYRLVTSIKLDKVSAVDGSIGIIFMAQPDGKGGFIFEINREEKFRLRQINDKSYGYLTGLPEDGGWVKSEVIKGLNLPNLVEIRTSNKNYDIYINNSLMLSFQELQYKTGGIGFIIGPSSKGKSDFIYLFTNNSSLVTNEQVNESDQPASPETDIIALAESIISLKTQINKLQEENEDQKQIIDAMKTGEREQEIAKAGYDKRIKSLESDLKKSSASFDSLLKVNSDLQKYKEMVKGNDNGDLVINLSKTLKNEKAASDELRKANKQLTDSLNLLRMEIKTLKSKSSAESSKNKEPAKQANQVKENKEFVLPKEN